MSDMKLHEAIRLGAMDTERGFGRIWSPSGRVCAIGAALHACGKLIHDNTEENYDIAKTEWPILTRVMAINPENGDEDQLQWVIISLNDMFDWTREQIADWVEQIERRADADQGAQPETPATAVAPVRTHVLLSHAHE